MLWEHELTGECFHSQSRHESTNQNKGYVDMVRGEMLNYQIHHSLSWEFQSKVSTWWQDVVRLVLRKMSKSCLKLIKNFPRWQW